MGNILLQLRYGNNQSGGPAYEHVPRHLNGYGPLVTSSWALSLDNDLYYWAFNRSKGPYSCLLMVPCHLYIANVYRILCGTAVWH